MTRGDDPRNEIGDGATDHTGLAQRGEYLIDVMQECRTRADHQHAGTFQCTSVRVQQVGGPVQGHRGLACARAALHHHGLIEIRADDAVLLRLDGGHDVGHLTGSFGVERGQQRTLAGQCAG